MSEQLKQRTRKFALDVIKLCHSFPQTFETRYAVGQLIRASSSVAANYRSACRGKSRLDFIAKLGTVEEEADESGFWLEMLRDILLLGNSKSTLCNSTNNSGIRHSLVDRHILDELGRLEGEAGELVAIIVASRKTARRNE